MTATAHRDEAVLVRGQGADRRQQPEEGQGAGQTARRQHRVAILHHHHRILARCASRHGAQRPCQRLALAGRPAAHQDQPHPRRRGEVPEQILDQPLIGHLDHGGDQGHRAGVADSLGDRRREHRDRGLGRDAVARDDQEHLAGHELAGRGLVAQPVCLRAPTREYETAVPEGAAEMQRAPAPAPHADPAEDEDECAGARAPHGRGRLHRQRQQGQEIERQGQGSGPRFGRRGRHWRLVGFAAAVHSREWP